MENSLSKIYEQLGITDEHLVKNKLPYHPQPSLEDLRIVDIDFDGKPFVLKHDVAIVWINMQKVAASENVHLHPFSGFRSYLHQKRLIEYQLKNGRSIDAILTHIAIPGYSEHHSGRAIDIYSEGKPYLEEDFEQSIEFEWLTKNAANFGFYLSYPRSNSVGIIYEPWHWFYKP